MAALDVLLLRFDAPLMSFGGVRVDDRGVIDEAPGLSLVTGLVANALGWTHGEAGRLARLQARLRLAARRDRQGELLEDFQTVDLGQPTMEPGWTTSHRPAERKGASGGGTHIRRRQYWADAVYTVALTLDPAAEEPDLDAIEKALQEPERPLFLGRKPCLPADRLLLGRTRAATLKDAVAEAPLCRRHRASTGTHDDEDRHRFAIWWPADEEPSSPDAGERRPVYDLRDWANQVHTGRRFIHRGSVDIPEARHEP